MLTGLPLDTSPCWLSEKSALKGMRTPQILVVECFSMETWAGRSVRSPAFAGRRIFDISLEHLAVRAPHRIYGKKVLQMEDFVS